jgi:hypothetical protein
MNAINPKPPSAFRIEQVMSVWAAARARLLSEDAELIHDEDALNDLLGDEAGDVRDILARLLRAAEHAKTMAAAAEVRADEIKARRDRYKRRNEAFRATAFAILDAMGERKFELPDLTATVRAGVASAVITDETALADEYIRVTRAPDKAAILADLKQGVVIKGAELSNGIPSIQIRGR